MGPVSLNLETAASPSPAPVLAAVMLPHWKSAFKGPRACETYSKSHDKISHRHHLLPFTKLHGNKPVFQIHGFHPTAAICFYLLRFPRGSRILYSIPVYPSPYRATLCSHCQKKEKKTARRYLRWLTDVYFWRDVFLTCIYCTRSKCIK